VVGQVDEDDSDQIDFQEFCYLMERHTSNIEQEEELTEAFKVFDKDGDGMVTRADLRKITNGLKWGLTDDQVAQMMIEGDVRGNGTIDYQE
jgi:calmodulin